MQGRRSATTVRYGFAGMVLTAMLLFAGTASGASRPDLVGKLVSKVYAGEAGEKLEVKDLVRNSGSKRAGRTNLGYRLSDDKKPGKGDIALKGGRKVKPLGPGKKSKRTSKVSIPNKVELGAYHLIACADAKDRLEESSERNNCRASKNPLGVTPRPDPHNVHPVPDNSRGVSADIEPGGGALSATAADGTRFTLTLPEGALLSTERVTMTPLVSIGDFPLSGGLVGGVQLGPEGLSLLKPATLRIDPPVAVPDERRTGFAYRGEGDEFHLYPSAGDGSAITLELTHFSGYGAGQETEQGRSDFAERNPPSRISDQGEQQQAAGDELAAIALAMYSQIGLYAESRDTIELAVNLYQWWAPIATGTPAAPAFAQLPAMLDLQLRRHLVEARTRCVMQKDLREAAWIMRLASIGFSVPAATIHPVAEEAAGACLRFEFSLGASLNDNSEIEPTSLDVTAEPVTARLLTILAPETFHGQGSLEVLGYNKADWECWSHTWSVTPADPIVIRGIRFSGLNPQEGRFLAPELASVTFDPGSLNESITHTCSDDGESYTDSQNVYRDGMVATGALGAVSGWQRVDSTRFRRELPAGGGYSGHATLLLTHTPGE